jgi:hypothetical protein
MNPHPVQALDPVFEFLDTVIEDYGLYLFMGFVYVAIPFLVWVLCGGLRRRLLKGRPMTHVPPVIVIPLPGRPPQPPETFNPFPPYHQPPHSDCNDAGLD